MNTENNRPMTQDVKQDTRVPIIRYPRFKNLLDEIRLCQRMTKIAGEAHCMSLEGGPGAGKTTLVSDYRILFPRIETKNGTEIPVFYVETPSPARVKGMASHMLEQLGDPFAYKGTLASMSARLIGLIRDCNVKLVILDDFHHLIDSKTNHVLGEVSDWLKVLIKETQVTFLVVGMIGQVEMVLRANDQLSRLFATRTTLEPFSWDPTHQKTIYEFSTFISYVEEARLPITKELGKIEMHYRIHYATNGVVANIMNLLNLSAVLASDKGRREINLNDLSHAFDKRLARHLRRKINPFNVDANTRFEAPMEEKLEPEPNKSKRQGRFPKF